MKLIIKKKVIKENFEPERHQKKVLLKIPLKDIKSFLISYLEQNKYERTEALVNGVIRIINKKIFELEMSEESKKEWGDYNEYGERSLPAHWREDENGQGKFIYSNISTLIDKDKHKYILRISKIKEAWAEILKENGIY